MTRFRMKVAPDTLTHADESNLVVEFAIPGAPADTIDVKLLEYGVHLTAPARNIEYVAALALAWPVKPDKAIATYEHGLLRIEVPFKDPMEDAVKVAIKAGGVATKAKEIEVGHGATATDANGAGGETKTKGIEVEIGAAAKVANKPGGVEANAI